MPRTAETTTFRGAGKLHAAFGASATSVALVITVLVNYFTGIETYGPELKVSPFAIAIYLFFVFTGTTWMVLIWAVTLLPAKIFGHTEGALAAITTGAAVGTLSAYWALTSVGPFAGVFLGFNSMALAVVGVLTIGGSVWCWWRVLRRDDR